MGADILFSCHPNILDYKYYRKPIINSGHAWTLKNFTLKLIIYACASLRTYSHRSSLFTKGLDLHSWQQLDHSTLPIDLLDVVVRGNSGYMMQLFITSWPWHLSNMKAENAVIPWHRPNESGKLSANFLCTQMYHSGDVYCLLAPYNEKRRWRWFRDWGTTIQGRSHSNTHTMY